MNAGTPLTAAQVAELHGVCAKTILNRVADGTYPVKPHAEGPGRKRVFPAGVVHFHLIWHRLPESPAELAEHLDHFPLEESA